MKLTEQELIEKKEEFQDKGYEVPRYDREALKENTKKEPTWIHIGTGNIFRAFPAAVLNELINKGCYDRGVIAVEGYDYEIIEKAYRPFDNLSLLVVLNAEGTIDKKVIGSVTDAIAMNETDKASWEQLEKLFQNPSLQIISFTITEKGYRVSENDLLECPAKSCIGKVTALLLKRYQAGKLPLSLVSMDNCSHNGDKLKAAVLAYARKLVEEKIAEEGFVEYLLDDTLVAFPLTMIDKITPRPDEKVVQMLKEDGFEDTDLIITNYNTYTAGFVNAEKAQYLVIEDCFPNGCPPLDQAGIVFTDRETVEKTEKMKVCTCLNPLHTALAIFGCLLGYKNIWKEMLDEDLNRFVRTLGYKEGMPVVVDPGVLNPKKFLEEVLTTRLPNPFMPDTPQRIATDTSQKISIRYGETLKAYQKKGCELTELTHIPFVLAGYLRYLTGIDDQGKQMQMSPDPLLDELMTFMKPYAGFKKKATKEELQSILGRKDVFGMDLYEAGLADLITSYFNSMNRGVGKVRAELSRID